jgi:cytochrome c oxidase subunit 2
MRLGTPHRRAGCAVLGLAIAALLAGCGGDQNTVAPHSGSERSISHLWWVMLVGSAVGFAVIVALLVLGWVRRDRPKLPFGGDEKAATAIVIGLGVAVPVVVLTLLFVWADLFVIRKTDAPAKGSTAMTIEVIGHQWWWEVRYPGTSAVTADEIHIPVDTAVNVVVTTADVIHSFWVPELNRKIDTIPGRSNRVELDADRPGLYRGQCAEFCGLQHAHMEISVYVQPRAEFAAWLANMEKPARPPATALAREGRHVFLENACASCHQVRGTSATGRVGPDLTHLASRRTLAGGEIPNTPGELAAWIRDPQTIKPGNKMPALRLADGDWRALDAYLEALR